MRPPPARSPLHGPAQPAPSAGRPAGPGLSAKQPGKDAFAVSDGAVPNKETAGRVMPPVVHLMDIPFAALTERGVIEYIIGELDAGRGGWVITPNLDILRRLAREATFRALASHATLLVADGMPLVWASRLQGTPLPQRVAGSNLISTLSQAAAEHGRSIFLLGGAPGAADGAAQVLMNRHPHLRIAGCHCPEMGFEKDPAQIQAIADALERTRPDIVYVALGSPKQEQVITRLRVDHPGVWWLGIGISFSFLAGDVRRAPLWMQRVGLEWVHRLYQEPQRLAKRYLVTGVPFGVQLLARTALNRVTGSQRVS